LSDMTPSSGPEPSELDKAAAWLERLTRDPLADAVRGRVRVVAVSEPAARGRYQECDLDLLVEADGIPPTRVRQQLVFPRKTWPRVGDVVPARVSRSDPEVFEADWDRLTRR